VCNIQFYKLLEIMRDRSQPSAFINYCIKSWHQHLQSGQFKEQGTSSEQPAMLKLVLLQSLWHMPHTASLPLTYATYKKSMKYLKIRHC